MIDQIFIVLLMLNAAWVAYGLCRKRVMWKWIACYWITLTVKNLLSALKITY